MGEILTYVLLLMSLSGALSKYVFIKERKTRDDALSYCRQHYTDLAPISNEQDNSKLQQLSGNLSDYIWIGLERNSSDKEKWLWSGGGAVSRFFWRKGEPNNYLGIEDYGVIFRNEWYDAPSSLKLYVFCYRAVVMRERKTWEEALESCREHHNDLASVASETEMMLIQRELKKFDTTKHVWIGLRFLSEDWQWMDGQELDYEAWGQGNKPFCPKMMCAALEVMAGSKNVWWAHDCAERLHFICY